MLQAAINRVEIHVSNDTAHSASIDTLETVIDSVEIQVSNDTVHTVSNETIHPVSNDTVHPEPNDTDENKALGFINQIQGHVLGMFSGSGISWSKVMIMEHLGA
ncbi:hypothetical protein F2Q70_00043361 [Brassica cretica]|uniref:Uncharacterized protein n=1 Tax=Brassica cretica TaxID=69181 RepID=A0A8S9KGL7_BRACR|nr:hypothetical protein F2Q70_00043361 [Brassica cretica]